MKSLFIDSDIFVRDLRYDRDVQNITNRSLLEMIRKRRRGFAVTSIFNVLEVCGIMSFNLASKQLLALYSDFCRHYNIQVLFPANTKGDLQYDIPRVVWQIQKKQSLGDAQISYVIERFSGDLTHFLSWDAKHFQGKLSIPTMTPKAYLEAS